MTRSSSSSGAVASSDAGPAVGKAMRTRAPRYRLALPAFVQTATSTTYMNTFSVSRGGCGLSWSGQVPRIGSVLYVRLGGGQHRGQPAGDGLLGAAGQGRAAGGRPLRGRRGGEAGRDARAVDAGREAGVARRPPAAPTSPHRRPGVPLGEEGRLAPCARLGVVSRNARALASSPSLLALACSGSGRGEAEVVAEEAAGIAAPARRSRASRRITCSSASPPASPTPATRSPPARGSTSATSTSPAGSPTAPAPAPASAAPAPPPG